MKKPLLQLARDTALVYGAQMTGVIVGLGLSILISRLMGPDGRGAYAWIMAMHFMAVQLGTFGADTANRRIGAARAEMTPTLAANSLIQSIVLGSLAGLLVLGFAMLQPIGVTHKMGIAFGMMAVPGGVAMMAFISLASARGKAALLATTEICQRLLLVLLVGSAYFTLGYLSLNVVMAGIVLTMFGTGALAIWQVKGIIPLPWKPDFKQWWGERFLMFGGLGSGMATFGLQKLDLLMLGLWRPIAESGWYAVAQTLMDASLILPGTLGWLLLSRLAALPNRAEQRQMLGRVLGIVLGAFAVIAATAAGLSGWVIPLLFGAQFVASVPVFHVLMVGAVAGAGFAICQNAAVGMGRVRYVMAGPLAGVAVKAGAGMLLVPSMGMMGAAWANVTAYVVAALVALGVAWGRRK